MKLEYLAGNASKLFIIQLPQQLRLVPQLDACLTDRSIYTGSKAFTELSLYGVSSKCLVVVNNGGAELYPIACCMRSMVKNASQQQIFKQVTEIQSCQKQNYLPFSNITQQRLDPIPNSKAGVTIQTYSSLSEFFSQYDQSNKKDVLIQQFQTSVAPLRFPETKLRCYDFYFDIMQYKFAAHLVSYLNGNISHYVLFEHLFREEIGGFDQWQKSILKMMRSASSKANFQSVIKSLAK